MDYLCKAYGQNSTGSMAHRLELLSAIGPGKIFSGFPTQETVEYLRNVMLCNDPKGLVAPWFEVFYNGEILHEFDKELLSENLKNGGCSNLLADYIERLGPKYDGQTTAIGRYSIVATSVYGLSRYFHDSSGKGQYLAEDKNLPLFEGDYRFPETINYASPPDNRFDEYEDIEESIIRNNIRVHNHFRSTSNEELWFAGEPYDYIEISGTRAIDILLNPYPSGSKYDMPLDNQLRTNMLKRYAVLINDYVAEHPEALIPRWYIFSVSHCGYTEPTLSLLPCVSLSGATDLNGINSNAYCEFYIIELKHNGVYFFSEIEEETLIDCSGYIITPNKKIETDSIEEYTNYIRNLRVDPFESLTLCYKTYEKDPFNDANRFFRHERSSLLTANKEGLFTEPFWNEGYAQEIVSNIALYTGFGPFRGSINIIHTDYAETIESRVYENKIVTENAGSIYIEYDIVSTLNIPVYNYNIDEAIRYAKSRISDSIDLKDTNIRKDYMVDHYYGTRDLYGYTPNYQIFGDVRDSDVITETKRKREHVYAYGTGRLAREEAINLANERLSDLVDYSWNRILIVNYTIHIEYEAIPRGTRPRRPTVIKEYIHENLPIVSNCSYAVATRKRYNSDDRADQRTEIRCTRLNPPQNNHRHYCGYNPFVIVPNSICNYRDCECYQWSKFEYTTRSVGQDWNRKYRESYGYKNRYGEYDNFPYYIDQNDRLIQLVIAGNTSKIAGDVSSSYIDFSVPGDYEIMENGFIKTIRVLDRTSPVLSIDRTDNSKDRRPETRYTSYKANFMRDNLNDFVFQIIDYGDEWIPAPKYAYDATDGHVELVIVRGDTIDRSDIYNIGCALNSYTWYSRHQLSLSLPISQKEIDEISRKYDFHFGSYSEYNVSYSNVPIEYMAKDSAGNSLTVIEFVCIRYPIFGLNSIWNKENYDIYILYGSEFPHALELQFLYLYFSVTKRDYDESEKEEAELMKCLTIAGEVNTRKLGTYYRIYTIEWKSYKTIKYRAVHVVNELPTWYESNEYWQ